MHYIQPLYLRSCLRQELSRADANACVFRHQRIYRLVSPFIQATNDLENYDKERHDEFKRYEMMKEHNRREHLKTLDDEERRKEEQHYEEMRKKHADHPKINHPVSGKGGHTDGGSVNSPSSLLCSQGSQNQLKEVWEEADGLDPEDFDPKTFFKLHGRHWCLALTSSAAGKQFVYWFSFNLECRQQRRWVFRRTGAGGAVYQGGNANCKCDAPR